MIIVEISPHNSGKRNRVKLRPTSKIFIFTLILASIFLSLNFFWPQNLSRYFQVSGSATETTSAEDIKGEYILTTNVELTEPELMQPDFKHTNYLTSILLVGVDTRDVTFEDGEFVYHSTGFDNSVRNTDTIIQIVYDNLENRVFMISIPRDMGVDVEEDCMTHHGKINAVYDIGQTKNCPGGGEAVLNQVVADVTGIDVHYYAYVTLEAFTETVETFGTTNDDGEVGLNIYNPEQFWEAYPNDYGGWINLYFPKGDLFLNSTETLQYIRSRHYSSDFSRIRRQQIFLEALKESIYESEVWLNPQKILHMMAVYKEESIITVPSLSEIRAGIDLLDSYDEIDIYNIYLDPDLGGDEVYIDKQPHGRTGGWYYMTPSAWRECPGNEFCKVQELISNIIKKPEVHEESPKVVAYSSSYLSGKPNFSNDKYSTFIDSHLPTTIIESKYLGKTDFTDDIIILDFSDGKYPHTLELLAEQLGARILPGGKAPNVQINKEDIAIVINN